MSGASDNRHDREPGRLRRLIEFTAFAALGFVLAGLLSPRSDAQAPPATSQTISDQLQWGDVFADLVVDVRGQPPGGAEAGALAAGNTLSAANLAGSLGLRSRQTMSGATRAYTTLLADVACCHAIADAAAQGNALEAQTRDGDLDVDADQVADGGDVVAQALLAIDSSQLMSSSASAAANNAAMSAERGNLLAALRQSSSASVFATAEADACCAGEGYTFAGASANAFSATGSTTTLSATFDQQSMGAAVQAAVDHYQRTGFVVSAATTASGNSATFANEYGYTAIAGTQANASAISATTLVTLDSWADWVLASSYGVGNAMLLTNLGADVRADAVQTNTGAVDAQASLAGGSASADNGAAILSSSAIGNAFTAYVCSSCGQASIGGSITQANGGDVRATGSIIVQAGGGVTGSASAIGNSASFITSSRQN